MKRKYALICNSNASELGYQINESNMKWKYRDTILWSYQQSNGDNFNFQSTRRNFQKNLLLLLISKYSMKNDLCVARI